MDMDMDIQVLNQLVGLNNLIQPCYKISLTDFHLPPQQSEFPATSHRFLPTTSKTDPIIHKHLLTETHWTKMFATTTIRRQGKRWNKPIATPTSTMIPRKRIECLGKGNKSRNSETTRGEVIHVRARRGQATSSHSLVERVRRQRINSRFKRLQDTVPDYGMSVMLDEIINYVQSLQNQVEEGNIYVRNRKGNEDVLYPNRWDGMQKKQFEWAILCSLKCETSDNALFALLD